ncbi:HAD family hydrolase [Verrucomicrobiota bacterium]
MNAGAEDLAFDPRARHTASEGADVANTGARDGLSRCTSVFTTRIVIITMLCRRIMKLDIAIFDVDGTLRSVADPWLHLHAHLGTAKEGEGFYARWKEGQISYAEMAALDASVWRGFTRKRMLSSLASNPLRDGAGQLIAWVKVQGVPCVGVSTGLSLFNDHTAHQLGLDEVVSNELVFSGETCTGEVIVNVEEDSKAEVVRRLLQRYEIDGGKIVAFGDSEADVPMFDLAAVSVAVFPRSPEVRRKADLVIESEPIDRVVEQLAEYCQEEDITTESNATSG